jgi:hypothetical protein
MLLRQSAVVLHDFLPNGSDCHQYFSSRSFAGHLLRAAKPEFNGSDFIRPCRASLLRLGLVWNLSLSTAAATKIGLIDSSKTEKRINRNTLGLSRSPLDRKSGTTLRNVGVRQ